MEISKNKASVFGSLGSKKMRMKHGLFIAEGEKCMLDTLGAFELENIVATEAWLESHAMPEGVRGGDVLTASGQVMRKISTLATPPEVLAVFRLPEEESVQPLDLNKLYLCLDGIQDPGNLGTIIRTADWFGFDEIYASKDTVDLFNPKTVQSTMGSLKRVRVRYVDLPQLLRESGVRNIYGTLLDGENIFTTPLESNGVIVMGNEGNGLSEPIRALVSKPLLIPPYNEGSHAESLNVAIATAITIAQFRR